jgi:DNA repair exonuclease SbcCD ATPase subunit
MATNPEFYITLLAEALFIALVVAVVRMAFVARNMRRYKRQIDSQEQLIAALTEKLSKAQLELKARAAHDHVRDAMQTHLREAEQQLVTQQQRIDNLERFRGLYFELDKRISGEAADMQARDAQLQELCGVVSAQDTLIRELKDSVQEWVDKYGLAEAVRENLERTIAQLEDNADTLRRQLQQAERQQVQAALTGEELAHYKERVARLEDAERKLQREAQGYRSELEQIGPGLRGPNPYGQVRLVEIEHMSRQLKKKEDEIRHLRDECETIARQYEALASTSMKSVSEDTQVSTEQRARLQQLQASLAQTSAALAQKQAECEQLEGLYQRLKNSGSKSAADLMESSFAERRELESQMRELAEQAEIFADDSSTRELADLRRALREKETVLETLRRTYQELKEQFIEVASEDANLKTDFEQLKKDNAGLRLQLIALRRDADQAQVQEAQVKKLRQELSDLEIRYLKLAEGRPR